MKYIVKSRTLEEDGNYLVESSKAELCEGTEPYFKDVDPANKKAMADALTNYVEDTIPSDGVTILQEDYYEGLRWKTRHTSDYVGTLLCLMSLPRIIYYIETVDEEE